MEQVRIQTGVDPSKVMLIAGFLLITVAFLNLSFVTFSVSIRGESVDGLTQLETTSEMLAYFLASYANPLFALAVGLISSALGYGLLRAAKTASKQVIPENDRGLLEDLLKKGDKGIDNYIRLSSLTGLVGTFTKIGLSGLPLATIALTLLFALLSTFSQSNGPAYFDLAKLTLGAFLGSYVQRERGSASLMQVSAEE